MSSRTVDSKVVEMKFDNKNFESNVSQSMRTIDSLKSKLNFSGTESKAAKSLGNISRYANNIDMSGMARAIDTINYRFSTLGIVASNVINQITTSITGKLSNAFNSVFGQIKTGGLSRAKNLAQAKFQLENLLKDEEKVSAVMANVKDAVDGTAYGLDAAAVVASQLVASGSQAGDGLFKQLRAIAGVAALTGGTYEEIGNIFTTVAGQGRLLAMQMNQLAFRGLNVAAVMSKQMGITEEEFRDKVHDSEISFQQFSDAMVTEFSEAAGKANETFTGALSNTMSALSRIGEKFYTPWLTQSRDMLNEFRLAINAVNKELDPFINKMNEMYASLSVGVQTVLRDFTKTLNDKPGENGLSKFISDVASALDNFNKVIFGDKNAFANWDSAGVWKILNDSGFVSEKYLETLKKVASESGVQYDKIINDYGSLEKAIKKSGTDIFSRDIFNKSTSEYLASIDGVVSKAKEVKTAVKLLEELSDSVGGDKNKVKEALKSESPLKDVTGELASQYRNNKDMLRMMSGISKQADANNKTISEYSETMIANLAKQHGFTKAEVEYVLKMSEEVDGESQNIIANIQKMDEISSQQVRTGYFDALVSVLGTVSVMISSITSALINSFNRVGGFNEILAKIASHIKEAADMISKWFKDTDRIDKLTNTFMIFASVFKIILNVLDGIGIAFEGFLKGLGFVGDSALSTGEKLGQAAKKFADFVSETKVFQKIGTAIGSVFKIIGDGVKTLTDINGGIIISLGRAVTSLFLAFFGGESKGIVDIIEKVSEKINNFADNLGGSESKIAAVGKKIEEFFDKLYELFNKFSGSFFKADILGLLTAAFLKLGTSIRLGIIHFKSFTGIFKLFDGAGESLVKLKGLIGDFSSILIAFADSIKADVLLKSAIAIGILAGSFFVLAGIPVEDLIKAGISIAAVTALLVGVGFLLTRMMRTPLSNMSQFKGFSGFVDFIKEFIGQGKEVLIMKAKFEAIGNAFLKLGAAIFLMAKALKMIAEAIREDPTAALQAGIVIVAMAGLLVGSVWLLTKIIDDKIDKTAMTRAATTMLLMAVSLLVISLAFTIVANTVKSAGIMESVVAVGVLLIMVIALSVSVTAIIEALNTVKVGALAASIGIILAISAFILAIAVSFALVAVVIQSVDWYSSLGALVVMLVMVAALVAVVMVLAGVSMALTPAALAAIAAVVATLAIFVVALGFAFLELAAAISIIIGALMVLAELLSGDKCAAAWAALGYLLVMMLSLTLGLTLLTAGIVGVLVLELLADALKTLIPLLVLIAAMPSEQIWDGIGHIAQALLGFTLVGLLATALSPLLLVFAAVLAAVGAALTLCAAAIAIFVIAFTALGAIVDMSWDTIERGLTKVADGIHNLAMKLLNNIGGFIDKLNEEMEKNRPKIKNTIKNLIETATETIKENLPTLIQSLKDTINILAEELHLTGIVNFITTIRDVINNVFQFLADVINPSVNAEGGKTADEYGGGIYGKVRSIAEKAIDIFVAFCHALGDVVYERGDEINAAVEKLANAVGFALKRYIMPKAVDAGKSVVSGLLKGLSNLPGLAGSSAAVGKLIIDNINSGTDSHSPSKKAIKAAKNVISGLILGLRSNIGVVRASQDLGGIVTSNINSALDLLQSYVENDYTIEPVIAPVLDMNGVTASANAINSMLSGNSSFGLAASINAQFNENQNENPYGDITKAIGTLHNDLQGLEANNYTVNGLTYDDGSSVAVAVTDLIRATKVGRRM